MSGISARDQRTIRYASIGIAIYLVLFFGFKGSGGLGKQKAQYQSMRLEAENLRREILPYEGKVQTLAKWMEATKIDPAKLDSSTMVAKASDAIQNAARGGGIVFSMVRESSNRGSEREMATFLFEGSGQVPALLTFIQGMGTLGFPLVIDSIQFSSDPMRPGGTKVTMTVLLLSFEKWGKEGVPNA